MAGQEQERARISRGLHDQVGQRLTALILELKMLEAGTADSAMAAKLKNARAEAETVAREIHGLAVELRPTALDDLGLLRALSNYLESWSGRIHTRVEFSHRGLKQRRLPPLIETTLYRIVCEALNNVTKHAQSSEVRVMIERRKHDARALIEDHGVGFDPEKAGGPRKIGIVSMKERAAILGGDVRIVSHPGDGTTVTVHLPLGSEE
jgi:signal transduction histidine kinase